MPFYASRGDYQANGNLYESDIVGSIANAIGSQVGKLNPQIVRQTAGAGLQIKDDYLSRLLALRWAPEYTPYDALYKMASDLVYRSNAFAVTSKYGKTKAGTFFSGSGGTMTGKNTQSRINQLFT